MTFKSGFSYTEVEFTGRNGKSFEIKDTEDLNLSINYYKEKWDSEHIIRIYVKYCICLWLLMIVMNLWLLSFGHSICRYLEK